MFINVTVPVDTSDLALSLAKISYKQQIKFIEELDLLNGDFEFSKMLIRLGRQLEKDLKDEDPDFEV